MSTEEQDNLMEHSYDGIQEYDNPLPSWWVNLFWACILFAVPYLLYYEMGIGPSVHDELGAQASLVLEQQSEKYKDMVITADLIKEKAMDSVLLSGMKQKFAGKCATCHGTRAQGGAGPNLTDNYWIHGGDELSILDTIRNGVPGKEMKAWESELGLGGVIGMAAYISTIRGTHVDGNPPKGSLYDPAAHKAPEPKKEEEPKKPEETKKTAEQEKAK